MQMEDVNIKYVVYATVNGSSTRRFVCNNEEELVETIKADLVEEIEEERLYQELNNTEDYDGQE